MQRVGDGGDTRLCFKNGPDRSRLPIGTAKGGPQYGGHAGKVRWVTAGPVLLWKTTPSFLQYGSYSLSFSENVFS
jgi:hypothetical protein